jgi:hypothetical protein
MGDPTNSYATAGISVGIIWPHAPTLRQSRDTMGGGVEFPGK